MPANPEPIRDGDGPVTGPGQAVPAEPLDAELDLDDDLLAEADDVDAVDVADALPRHSRFVIPRDSDKRLDVYLQGRLKGYSRAKVQELIAMGAVKLNDRKPKASSPIKLGDVIDVSLPDIAVRSIVPQNIPLDILYEDDDMIVLNKQAGIVVHPARSYRDGTLVNALAYHLKQQFEARGQTFQAYTTQGLMHRDRTTPPPGRPEADTVPGLSAVGATECRPGIVHRLDKNTTGVIVMAKRDASHWAIARQFEQRTPTKAYLAVVHGQIDEAGGVIDQPLGKHPTIREAFCVRHDHLGKHSVTLFRVRERYRGYTLVELELKTGRTHQIRVHMEFAGYPIVGDLIYGGEAVGPPELASPPTAAGARRGLNFARTREEGLKAEAAAAARSDVIMAQPALHAAYLQINHPVTGRRLTFTAPLHRPMLDLVHALRSQRIDGPVATDGWSVNLDDAIPPP